MVDLPPWPLMAAFNLLRVLLAMAFLFVLLPGLIFPRPVEPEGHPVLERGIWMVFYMVLVEHALVVLRINEAVAVLFVILATAAWTHGRYLKADTFLSVSAGVVGWALDLVDRKAQLPWLRQWRRPPEVAAALMAHPLGVTGWLNRLTLMVVLAVAAWMLFDESFRTPAPAFSDAPVNLAWLKMMDLSILYQNEVYPRGMYTFLTLVKKFSALNAVEILDATGPLVGFAILLSVVFFAYKTTGSAGAAIVTGLIYGTVPSLLPMDFARHVGHNSQEFGLVFALPAAWYAYAFLRSGSTTFLATAAAATGITAFTHPVPAVFTVIGVASMGLVALLRGGAPAWRRLPRLAGWCITAGLIAMLPPGIALAVGQKWHGSSVAYFQEGLRQALPPPDPVMLVVLGLGGLMLVGGLLLAWLHKDRDGGEGWTSRAAAGLSTAAAIGVFLLPYAGVDNEALRNRSVEFAAIGMVLVGALVWSVFEAPASRWPAMRPVYAFLSVALVAGAWYWLPPAPARPYHFYTTEMVEQYMRADKGFPPGHWTLVTGETGFALALGRSYHTYPDEFIAFATRMPVQVNDWVEAADRAGLSVSHNYILMVEKAVPLAPHQRPDEANPRLETAARLQRWIDENRDRLGLQLILDGREVGVWLLQVPFPKDPYRIFATPNVTAGPLGR